MYSRILVAVDESDVSELAIHEAIKLAKEQHAELYIIYIADEFIPVGEGVLVNFKEHEKSKREEGKHILNKMITIAKQKHNKISSKLIEVTESESHIAKEIIIEADNWHADLIVLGTHGRKGLSRLLLGSVAEEVVRNTTIPVHVVPDQS